MPSSREICGVHKWNMYINQIQQTQSGSRPYIDIMQTILDVLQSKKWECSVYKDTEHYFAWNISSEPLNNMYHKYKEYQKTSPNGRLTTKHFSQLSNKEIYVHF